jgi:hypothetical protein
LQSYILYGSSDKARHDYVQSLANENGYNFLTIDFKERELHSRKYITSGLDGRKCVFLFYDSENFGKEYKDLDSSTKFLCLLKSSPHIFFFSFPTKADVNVVFKKFCISKDLGSTKEATVNDSIKELMTNPDRDAVRFNISMEDPNYLFHILKKQAWQSLDSLKALLEINRFLYKINKGYMTSLLAYSLPKKAYATYSIKKDDNKMVKSIQRKLVDYYKMNPDETADLYQLVVKTHSVPEEVGLTLEEKQFLGVEKTVQAIPTNKPVTKSLESFF